MSVHLSARSNVEPFLAMDVLAEANRMKAAGEPVISMAVGQPGDPAPQAVLEAARAALGDGRIAYTDAPGLPALREAIAAHYAEHYDVAVSPGRIFVTTGSSAGFNLAFLAMFDAGDRVAITAPGYPAYRNILRALGLQVVEIPLDGEGYLKADQIRQAHEQGALKGVLFASPANPTGAIIPDAELRSIRAVADELDIMLISDEIYHRLNFSGPDTTALSLDSDIAVINSFSKYYCMTGWRIGWMVLPEKLVRPVERIAQSLYISAPELSQRAAVAAFDATAELEAVKARYATSRAHLLEALPALGFTIAAPMDGAFYAYCDVSRFTNDSMEFARRMLAEAKVAATPGLDFDPVQGHRTMRFSYAGTPADMREATNRIGNWLSKSGL
ncbi:MAG: aminotransferase class I/II-fold pyridoxal phosphate-dependent enzyme [Notoacmeibacter sp.]|nr:aminotransferase class I/II-fold pyridoxal phosphate-dependent enzyme [Notoacmeibacter sp.]